MSQFIELTDYDASIHREILDALTREDESIVEICEDRTLAERGDTSHGGMIATACSPRPVRNATSWC